MPDGCQRASARHGLQPASEQQDTRRRPAHRSRRAVSIHQHAGHDVPGGERTGHIGRHEEEVGNFKNNGREWRRQGRPELVNIHDFIDPKLSRAVPYGVYDITNNVGCVSVGTDHDTASFAVNAIRRWWRQQRVSCAPMEGRASKTGGRAQVADHGLPPAARHQQVEQDRASSLLHHHQLAGKATA
ncbi:hypothetical protein FXB38_35880 [Bradyrhizobium cytisi]|uniref:Transposase n=1 Tax=Bradyrhizobium cytisi TaxID=515489 RepID=A0A5S4W653_9BRAD|nr:hypothetical protein FXB38_35880 [Bradyrhizobium cytisi]